MAKLILLSNEMFNSVTVAHLLYLQKYLGHFLCPEFSAGPKARGLVCLLVNPALLSSLWEPAIRPQGKARKAAGIRELRESSAV